MGTWTRTKDNYIPNVAFYLLNYTHILRRDEVPTPKHFTAPIVFKTSPSPTELSLHLPTYRCRIGLCFVISVQTMRELNPNLHIDSVICKPLHYIAYIVF